MSYIKLSILKVLEDRIIKFTTSGEEMIGKDGGEHIERELFSLRQRWLLFKEQISQTRQLIDLTIKYFTLVEEVWISQLKMCVKLY